MLNKLYTVEVTKRGPEGIVDRFQSERTTDEIATLAVDDIKARVDQMDEGTHAAEAEEAAAQQ